MEEFSNLFTQNASRALTITCFVFQNDDNFLNIIYEAYLFSVRKAAIKKSLWKMIFKFNYYSFLNSRKKVSIFSSMFMFKEMNGLRYFTYT